MSDSDKELIESLLRQVLKAGHRLLVVDMSGLLYVNSTGLGALMDFADRFREAKGRMLLVAVPSKVRVLLERLGLIPALECFPDRASAVKSLT